MIGDMLPMSKMDKNRIACLPADVQNYIKTSRGERASLKQQIAELNNKLERYEKIERDLTRENVRLRQENKLLRSKCDLLD